MNTDHLIDCFRFYSETNTMQADLIRRKSKRGPAMTRTGAEPSQLKQKGVFSWDFLIR